jgi:hypothetical protein
MPSKQGDVSLLKWVTIHDFEQRFPSPVQRAMDSAQAGRSSSG